MISQKVLDMAATQDKSATLQFCAWPCLTPKLKETIGLIFSRCANLRSGVPIFFSGRERNSLRTQTYFRLSLVQAEMRLRSQATKEKVRTEGRLIAGYRCAGKEPGLV